MSWQTRAVATAAALGVLLAAAVVFATSLPIVTPSGDMALMDIHQINVARHLEPVGSYSRYQWHHPGPLYAWLQLPVFWLSDYRHLATSVTTMFVNVSALLLTGWVMYRRSQTAVLMWAAAICTAGFVVRVPGLLANPWNPFTPILLLPLLVTMGAAAITTQPLFLPAVIGVASLVMQAHVGFASPAAAIVLSTCVGLAIVFARTPASRRAIAIAFAAALLVGAIAWAPPIWDAIGPRGSGNLQMLYAFFAGAEPHSPTRSSFAFVRYFTVPLVTKLEIPGGAPVGAAYGHVGLALLQAALLGGSALSLTFRRRRFEAVWSWLVVATVLASYLAVRRLPEIALDHTVFWISILGVLSWTAIATAIVDLAWSPTARARATMDRVSVGLAALAAVVLVATGFVQVRARAALDASPHIRALARPIRAELDRARVRAATLVVTQENWSDMAGVAYLLYRDGFELQVPADWVWMFGSPFAPRRQDVPAFGIGEMSAPDLEGAELLAVVSTTPIYLRRPAGAR